MFPITQIEHSGVPALIVIWDGNIEHCVYNCILCLFYEVSKCLLMSMEDEIQT